MGIIIGDLRYTIVFKKLTATKDDYGAITESYSIYSSLRAGVKFVSGTKATDLSETFTSQVVQFTTHFRESVEPTMQIEFQSKKYRILSIAEIGFKEGLLITTELIND